MTGDYPDVKSLTDSQAEELCARLRQDLIQNVARTGGHLASNLGTVELTVAIHRVFDTRRDRLVFDVGHQCYTHKLLTGRGDAMSTLRKLNGLSGFPKPRESEQDAFIAGHASNSVSVALGMARARSLMGEDYHVMALIGDGALTGGLAYEGLSDAGQSKEPLLVILNDNGMSITKNVGGVASYLAHQRLKPQYLRLKKTYRRLTGHGPVGRKVYQVTHSIKKAVKESLLPCSMFENMGFVYLGPVDGHDLKLLTRLLQYIRDELRQPVLLHVKTVKGKGYPPAEEHPNTFHGISPFAVETGLPLKPGGENFSAVFGNALCDIAREDSRVCAITAAMQSGTGLDEFAGTFPRRFFDVGIAEEHAVAMAAGMAKQGMVPVFAVYSTFLQRAYDMLLHDVALQGLHVVLAVDRAGLVGEDGETHQGAFDVAFLQTVPGMRILVPASFAELREMLRDAVYRIEGPVAVRFPRGGENGFTGYSGRENAVVLRRGGDLTVVTYGIMTGVAEEAARLLAERGVACELIKLNAIEPLDLTAIRESVARTGRLLVAEECINQGCVGQRIAAELMALGLGGVRVALCNLGDGFVTHGSVAQLRQLRGIDPVTLAEKGMEVCRSG